MAIAGMAWLAVAVALAVPVNPVARIASVHHPPGAWLIPFRPGFGSYPAPRPPPPRLRRQQRWSIVVAVTTTMVHRRACGRHPRRADRPAGH